MWMKREEGGTGQGRERHRKETVCVSGSRVGVSEQSFVVGADYNYSRINVYTAMLE